VKLSKSRQSVTAIRLHPILTKCVRKLGLGLQSDFLTTGINKVPDDFERKKYVGL